MKLLLNDSSVLLNLLASGCLIEIASALDWQFAICPAVRDETKKLRDAITGEMESVDLTPLIDAGLIQVLELAGEEEQTLYVEQSITVDDGEAMSIALAASRKLELAIDDRQASKHALRSFPHMILWTTPKILKQWTIAHEVSAILLKEAIENIETRSRYSPPRLHPLCDWWHAAKQIS